jgi:hypothetical protein
MALQSDSMRGANQHGMFGLAFLNPVNKRRREGKHSHQAQFNEKKRRSFKLIMQVGK